SRMPLITRGLSETRRLVELLADDVAVQSTDRLTLAEALLTLAGAPTPVAALGVGGASAARVRRLVGPDQPLDRRRRAGTFVGLVALLAPCCVSVMLPAYLATGLGRRSGVLPATLVFAVGVATVIVPTGVGATALSTLVSGHHFVVFALGGVAMMASGLAVLA